MPDSGASQATETPVVSSPDVWFRTGKWQSRLFPAEFGPVPNVRYLGEPLAVDRLHEVPIGATFEAIPTHEVKGYVPIWEEATRIAAPKRMRFLVDVEVEGDNDPAYIADWLRDSVHSRDIRETSVTAFPAPTSVFQVQIVGETIAGFRATRYARKVFLSREAAEAYVPDFKAILLDPKPFDALRAVEEVKIIELALQDTLPKDPP